MKAIHIADSRNRDAELAFNISPQKEKVRTILPDGREKTTARILKSTMEISEDRLLEKYKELDMLAEAIIDSDPEIDMELIGKKLRHTHQLYTDHNDNIAYRINLYQVIFNPDGTERDRRDINKVPANVNSEVPLKWTGRMYTRQETVRNFIFTRKYQIRHINGVTFDFLYNMAKELQEKDSMVLIGGGKKGTDPILLTRGGSPYRGFLEGRIDGEKYCLILHLSNIELKGTEQ